MSLNISVIAFFFLPFALHAQNIDSTSLGEQYLQPVEVRAVRAASEAPFSKAELKADEIEKQNLGQDIPYLLQYTPSAISTSDAGTGIGYSGLRIRGSDGSRINVTLNGIPVNDAESQGAFFVDFPDISSSLSSIQVQRGVGTSTNGAGSFGATLSLSNLEQMKEAGAEASLGFGSFNTQRYTLKAGTGLLNNGLSFDIRLSKISSDGYIERSASDLNALQFLAGWKISDKSSLRFMLMTGKEKTGQAWNGVPQDSLNTNRTFNELGLKADGSYYNNQTDNYQQDYYQLFFDHRFSSHLTANIALFLTRGKGYYEEYRMDEAFADYGLPDFISGTDTFISTDLIRQLWLDNYNYGTVLSLLYQKDETALSLGGAWTQYDGEHYGFVKWAQYGVPDNHRWYFLTSQKMDFNFYLKAQQRWKRVLLFGDIQYRNVVYSINGFRKNPALHPSLNYNFLNPKLGVTFFVKDEGRQKQNAYASFAIANKEPNRDDFEASENNLPKAEQLYDLEAGYRINSPKWNAAANIYYMKYKDQLVLIGNINDVGAYTRTNVPESYRAGIELAGSAKPFYWLGLDANATFSQNKIEHFTELIDDYDAGSVQAFDHGTTDIAFSPEQIFSGILRLNPFKNLSHHQNIELEFLNKYVGKQFLDNTSNEHRSLDPYYVADLRLRYSVRIKPFKELTATLACNNLFNHLYESNGYTFSYIYGGEVFTQNYYYPQAGTNWLFGLNMKW